MSGTTEIFYTGNLSPVGYGPIEVYVYVAYEPYPEDYKPLPDSEFDSYQPDSGFVLNTGLRTPLFSGPFLSSPLQPDGEYTYIADSYGYTWLCNTFNYMAVAPFNRKDYSPGITRYSAALTGYTPEGSIQLVVNDKNQPQTFVAKDENGDLIDRYFATDKHGNSFILGSIDTKYAGDPRAAFEAAVLPKGWTKTIKTFDSDYTIVPGYGDGNRCNYNQFRDNLTNNYFQVSFAKDGASIYRGIPGLALPGGNASDTIIGSGLAEIIYGAQGDDRLIGLGGNDQIWGDDGDDLINGGRGDNDLWGGSGQDAFVVRRGANTVNDFSLGDGDIIVVASRRYLASDVDGGIKIVSGLGSTIILGISQSDLVFGQNIVINA